MGKITKTAGERHEATLSPFLKSFIEKTTTLPAREIRQHLAHFPPLWPFPRGDLYHWIPALNRFDEILGQFVQKYELDQGPQTRPFGTILIDDGSTPTSKEIGTVDNTAGDQEPENDLELIKSILKFTALLLSNCGNRSLYASSDRLNDLLHTTSLPLLQLTLQLSLLLAKRYYSSKQRVSAVGGNVHLQSHYNIVVDRIRKLAAPFPTPSLKVRDPATPSASARGKEKKLSRPSKSSLVGAPDTKLNGADLVAIIRNDDPESAWQQWADVSVTVYPDKVGANDSSSRLSTTMSMDEAEDDALDSPSVQRTTTLPAHTGSAVHADSPEVGRARSTADRSVISHRRRSMGDENAAQGSTKPVTIDFIATGLPGEDPVDYLSKILKSHTVPQDSQFDLLHKVRTIKALISSKTDRYMLVAIRLLALANLSYIESDINFLEKVARPDSEQPRRMQVAYQLAELLQPADDPSLEVPLDLQTIALTTMDALTHQKLRAGEVYSALNANVNHGILFYVVRKAVSQLEVDEPVPNESAEEWREALFALLSSLPTVINRAGDMMMSAGLLEILLEVLSLRTSQAERTHWKALMFLDNFVYSVRDGYQSFGNAKGLDIVKDLAAYTVAVSYERSKAGDGMPEGYKAPILDYQIPFFLQLTLRWLFKFINHLMTHNSTNFGRQMRNLIDSPEMLDSLRKVLNHADVYGSNVWAGATSIFTTFIHHEPTMYSVIAESRLGETFLEALTKPTSGTSGADFSLLPVGEAISAVPQAFQALCLNEAGMKLVLESGALNKFFGIFTSPAHVKALDQDTDLANQLGSTFDELCRHQPTLRSDISAAVRNMVAEVAKLCNSRADDGFGSKLWVTDAEGKLYVAGGRKALSGYKLTGSSSDDVVMTGDDGATNSTLENVTMDEVIESKGPDRMPFPTAYLNAATHFLIGYLSNGTQCGTFVTEGGIEHALDFATSPCIPFSFEAMLAGQYQEHMNRMLQMLAESKPHIVLQAILKRLQSALTELHALLEHDAPTAFFAPFTNAEMQVEDQLTNPRLARGTAYSKALVVANILCSALAQIFGNPAQYTPRVQTNLFTQANLADVWVDVIDKLGRLQRSCTWEEILLINSMPEKWGGVTSFPTGMAGGPVVNPSIDLSSSIDALDDILVDLTDDRPLATEQAAVDVAQKREDENVRTPQYENSRVLRHLLHAASTEVSHFFTAIGKMLLVRRVPDPFQKQNAVKVAEQLAKSAISILRFQFPGSVSVQRRHEYYVVSLARVVRLMIDESYERTSPQTLTLILRAFKDQDGFGAVENVLNSFIEECKLEMVNGQPTTIEVARSMAGVKLVLHFYSRIINAKYVQDAIQTTAIGRSSDQSSPDYFSTPQFLVELRMAVIKPALRMWDESESEFMDKAITAIVKSLVEILKIELEGDGEAKALTRKDKIPARKKVEPRKWTPKNPADLERLKYDFPHELALEGLFRCYDDLRLAIEYCDYVKKLPRERAGFAIPEGAAAPPSRSRNLPSMPSTTNTPSTSESQPPRDDSTEGQWPGGFGGDTPIRLTRREVHNGVVVEVDDGAFNDGLPVPEMNRRVRETALADGEALLRNIFTEIDSSREASASPAQDDKIEAGKIDGLVTVDDLNDERAKLRKGLIDRCLGVLSVHDTVTFELADLLFAAVGKGSSARGSRVEIGNTLLLALNSLESSEEANEEDARQQNKRVASCAHLFALVLARDEFYMAIQPQLLDCFPMLVGFIKCKTPKPEDSVTPIANVLLVLERMLSDDATPPAIDFKIPGSTAALKPPDDDDDEPLVPFEDKERLFKAIMDVLPSIGKDESLAVSVLRILVILTRERQIAVMLSDKANMGRLFMMIRQLHGVTNEKVQSSFLIVLRHIIEDEELICNIMRNEIVAAWSSRNHHQRPFDTTTYARHFSHMAIRSPKAFVKATDDKVAIHNYTPRQGPQTLMLKEDPSAQNAVDRTATDDAPKTTDGDKADISSGKDKMEIEKVKSHDLKMPTIEKPDGVIHFILSELLKYKEVKDNTPATEAATGTEKAGTSAASSSTDVDMANGSAPALSDNSLSKESSKKTEFKAEDHPVYIYRCFLLQCLTELLTSYNRAKIEFVNFPRKGDAPGTTPSKPRSQVLNYLLHDLIPIRTLGHPEDISDKKRSKTSAWAMSTVVALCSKTGEGGFTRAPTDYADYKEEPELLFVRKWVLEHAIKSYRDAQSNESEPTEQRYSRLLCLADLFNRMLTGKPSGGSANTNADLEMLVVSQRMLAKIMYEKNFISALTSSISEIDLNFPNAKRAVKYILKPLKLLSQTANDLSLQSEVPIAPGSVDEDEISSESADESDIEGAREQTPDLFRNSALGMLEPRRDEDTDSESDEDDEDEDEEMFGEFGEEMEYEEEPMHDHDEVVSDEEQEFADMGPIEGRPGDLGVGMEIVGMEVDDDDEDDDDDDDDEDDSDDDDDSGEDEQDSDLEEIIDMEGVEGVLTADEDEDGSVRADDEDWGTEPEDGEEYPGEDEIEREFHMHPPAGAMGGVRVFNDDELLQRLADGNIIDQELVDEMAQEDDDMEEEEDFEEEDIAFEPEMDDDEEIEMRGMPWGWDEGDRMPGHRHHHHHGHRHSPWGLFSEFRDRMFPTSSYRSHRPGASHRPPADDGTNPLLQRAGHAHAGSGGRPSNDPHSFDPVTGLHRLAIPAEGNPASFISNLINAMSTSGAVLPRIHGRGGTVHVQIAGQDGSALGPLPRDLEQMLSYSMRHSGGRRPTDPPPRTPRDDPFDAVSFIPTLTTQRWHEEARILYGLGHQERATRVINSILQLLVPPAIEEQKRKETEEAERQKKLDVEREKARKEKEELERKEKEEKEARERKEREEREAAEAEAAARAVDDLVDEQMEGVESTIQAPDTSAASAEPSAAESTQRITTIINGQEIDITNLGIDPEYLAALPEDMRQEVIMEQTLAHRQETVASGGEQSELDPEFLQALPAEMRDELMQQVALDRRRQEREAARRRNAATGAPPRADDMDPATFFATLEPQLRDQVLMEVDDEALQSLPPQLQAQARQLTGHHRRLDHYVDVNNLARRDFSRGGAPGEDSAPRRKPTPYVQILDKAGVATLLRLMFIPQSGSVRNSLNGILRDVCHNKQNRAEVVSILLSILQDGSNDIGAVERSFSLLSLRAKQPGVQKTPQSKRLTPDPAFSSVGEMSPITVVQQCLVCLENLVQYNTRIAEFFLTEHETGTGFKPRSTRKGKGKETKATRYPINALLGLLDRKIIIESAPVMDLLASLLQRITHPLSVLMRKEKEKEEKEKVADELKTSAPVTSEGAEGIANASTATTADVEMSAAPGQSADIAQPEAPEPPAEVPDQKSETKTAEDNEDKAKKRTLTPPEVPEYNLRLIINIIAARECPSKTFKDTIALITNLSTIPAAKQVFGQELIRQAQDLGQSILNDLQELDGQIAKATSGADVQGMALAKFSPASSDQAKLLRVITALDFLFDPKRADTPDKPKNASISGMEAQQKEDILTTLYENQIFVAMWSKLGQCLTAIRNRGNMFNVANILLPLIEVLMVVCKNTTLKDAPLKAIQDFSLTSPEPESREARMETLFFTFTEEHRKVLNDLVRHNPKLMSGSFSLLVKNSKVLEFDNKRNYFNRRLHSRGSELRQPHPSLQLSVRREYVFLDSFKHLYYKKPEEFKYGKLSIRFAGEEGVDAGGVTREWFQALTKQMFDADYWLFKPVASDRTTFHPNPESGVNEQHLTFFKFIGRIIGKALYEGRVLDCHFSRALYKRILGRPISIKDMESLDSEYSKNLQWMLDNPINGLISETFSVEAEALGLVKTVDLIENGRDIEVTDDNKHEYVQRVVEYKLIGSVKEQMEHFLIGFHDIVPAELIAIFDEQELELLISGLPDIDVDDWKSNAEYHNYQASSPQIQWFWRAVRSFDKEERAKLLQFVTGTSKVPLNGFKELEGMNGFSRFNIHRDYGNKDRLPSSHTCFNQLDLPEYDSYEDLRKNLYMAITTGSEYFGFA